jgi:hypothetical protein
LHAMPNRQHRRDGAGDWFHGLWAFRNPAISGGCR